MMKEKESLFFDFIYFLKGKYKGFGRVKTF